MTLAGAVVGYRAYGDVLANGDTAWYAIHHRDSGEWEVGLGTWVTGGILIRTTIYGSSNAGLVVSLSAGTKDVFLHVPARHFAGLGLQRGIVARWPLNEASGSRADHHGVGTLGDNNATLAAAGLHYPLAANFVRASSQYLNLADSAAMSVGPGVAFSFALWIKPATLPGDLGIIQKGGLGALTEYFLEWFTDNKLYWTVGNATTTRNVSTAFTASGAWSAIFVDYDPTTGKPGIAINKGARVAGPSSALPGDVQDGAGEFVVGRYSTFYYDGLVQDLRFWKRLLTAEERAAYYAEGLGLVP